jgi:ketosteroid isomerase-like protein
VITVPAYPKRIEGRDNLAELYRGYGDTMVLCTSDLAVHHDRETSVVVLEYISHGRVVATGRPYSNRFVSIITIRDRKKSSNSISTPGSVCRRPSRRR